MSNSFFSPVLVYYFFLTLYNVQVYLSISSKKKKTSEQNEIQNSASVEFVSSGRKCIVCWQCGLCMTNNKSDVLVHDCLGTH